MIEYFAMSVSYAPIPASWTWVVTNLVAAFKADFGMIDLPRHARWVWVDSSQAVIAAFNWFDVTASWFGDLERVQVPHSRSSRELWLSMGVELAFARKRHPVDMRVRVAPGDGTCVELWFPTYVHTDIFRRDLGLQEFDPDAKTALMHVLTGVGKLLGADAFAYQNATEESLFGPPSIAAILDELDADKVWLLPDRPYKIAGLRSVNVPSGLFEPDEDDPPWHYRRAGYDIYDSVWPDSLGSP